MSPEMDPAPRSFECPVCTSERYEMLPSLLNKDRPLYKCANCHFHFSDPGAFGKSDAGMRPPKSFR